MRVLVTGGAGFIGSHVVDLLVDAGASVVVLDNLSDAAHASTPDYLNGGATYIAGDVADPEAVHTALDGGVDAVCHQAARVGLGVDFGDAPAYVRDNAAGTAALLSGLHDAGFAGPFVLASSMVVYGEGRYRCHEHGVVRPGPRRIEDLDAGRFEPPCPACEGLLAPDVVPEDAPLDPRNVYAATKLHQEHLCAVYGWEHASPVLALRYHNVYGPRMPRDTPYAGVASIFRSALVAGDVPQVYEDGGQRRDFVHVADVARANLLALDAASGVAGAFNVCSGRPHTILEMATTLSAAFGDGPNPVATGAYRVGDVRHVVACPARARDELGFEAKVAFSDGMRQFASAPLRASIGAL